MGKTDHETAFDEFFGPISAEASPNAGSETVIGDGFAPRVTT